MISKYWYIISLVTLSLSILGQNIHAQESGYVKFHFIHKANNKLIERDSIYTNISGEEYQITKLKYYLSNIKAGHYTEPESYYLLNAFAEDTFTIKLPESIYHKIEFMIGVDSLRNCSGAQTGALDPLNDMFWTWNTGYVMFKLEGNSPRSTADLQRIEHHLGGYSGPYKTMRHFQIEFPRGLEIRAGRQQDIIIEMNLDKYWDGIGKIKIAELPLIMTIGKKASSMADNLPGLFTLKSYTE